MYDEKFDLDDIEEPDPKQEKREQYENRKLAAAQKKLDEALERIKVFEEAETQRNVAAAFKEADLNPAWAKWYDGEQTPEAARSWAVENGLITPSEGETTTPEPPAKGWTPTVVNEGSIDPGMTMSYEKAMEMAQSNPAALEAYFAKHGGLGLEKLPGNSE